MEEDMKILVAEQIKTKREQEKTNKLLNYLLQCIASDKKEFKLKDDNDLLSPEQLSEETGIPASQIRQIFKNPDLPVQRYTKPQRVQRKAWNEFMSIRREEANEKAV